MSAFWGYAISLVVLALGTIYLFRTFRRFDSPLRWIFGTGLLVRVIYLFSSRPSDQANDWGGHLYYIRFIADRGVLPRWFECYECTHPPLFHSLFAAFLRPIRDGGFNEEVGLQWASLFFFSVALAALVGFLRNLTARPEVRWWAAALVTFWPRGLPLSITINNDLGAYVCSAVALDFLTRQRWVASAGTAAMGLLCKTSGIVVYPALVLWKFLSERRWEWKTGMNAAIAAGMVMLVAYTYHNREGRVTVDNAIIGNDVGIEKNIRLERGLGNFLCFDARPFLIYPDIAFDQDTQGRQCLWNFLGKTSLITEHYVMEPYHRVGALMLAYLLLLLVAFAGVGAWNVYRRDRSVFWLWSCLVASYLAGICLIRYQLPMSATGDFRYIFPVVAPFAGFAASSIGALPRVRGWSVLVRAVLAAFVVVSIAYYLVPLRR